MGQMTPFVHTLRRAIRLTGGRAQLAQHLDVAEADISRWLRGEEAPPPRPYLAALDLVARRAPVVARAGAIASRRS